MELGRTRVVQDLSPQFECFPREYINTAFIVIKIERRR